jgi:hypothetical protein
VTRVIQTRAGTIGWLWIALLAAILAVPACEVATAGELPAVPDVYSSPTVKQDRRGTENQPIVVTKPPAELRHEEIADSQHATNELRTTISTIVLAAFTVALTIVNILLIRDGRRVSARQAADTSRSIDEARRSADAMHDVAEATRNNAVLLSGMLSKQMRAYLTVEIGSALYQDEHLRFEARPVLTNNGLTPARNVCFRVMADILEGTNAPPAPVIEDLLVNDMGLAPRQQVTIGRVVANRILDAEVADVMAGTTRRLHAWGRVTYDDVFGGHWETKFYFTYYFPKMKDGYGVRGLFSTSHNNAT